MIAAVRLSSAIRCNALGVVSRILTCISRMSAATFYSSLTLSYHWKSLNGAGSDDERMKRRHTLISCETDSTSSEPDTSTPLATLLSSGRRFTSPFIG